MSKLARRSSREERIALANMIMRLFAHWQLSPSQQLALLGLSPRSQAVLSRYREGQPLGGQAERLARARQLLAIHQLLRLLFPRNRDLVYAWPSRANRAFGDKTPIQVAVDEGLEGLSRIRGYLARQCFKICNEY